MILSFFVAGLLLVPLANAFWRLPCAKPVLDGRIDPIINPGRASGHVHTIMGSNAIGFDTTFADLQHSDCSTCKVTDDKSAYWIPHMYYQFANGSFRAVPHDGMLCPNQLRRYYIQRSAANETVQPFPDGLRIVTGDPFVRSYTGTPESRAISWNCLDFNGPPAQQTPGFANTRCPSGLRAQVFFPACWDGVNLDSSDHKSHMAYPDGIDNGLCPPSHPVHLVSIFYEVYFAVAFFNALNDGGRFVLANGDPTGYGLHGDFMNGWDRSVLSRAITTCTADSGVIEDCPVFQKEGRFNADADMNACSGSNPLPGEPILGAVVTYLPGCPAVTPGPDPATPADLAPGCVARRSELESEHAVARDTAKSEVSQARATRPRRHRAMRGHGLLPVV
ncbi:WSC domain-containing protein [Russula earlei]|uniref:WSC domain-containing protein n=1 Tax=Russula earlei TaxID=71964 RepID=A0ACC0U4R2_9AGAM|nr:WSC domain-containing protein [Russula earlei]